MFNQLFLFLLMILLQVPGEGYTLTNGSILTFSEAPKGRETRWII